jgi:hypothetical protein
VVERHRLEQPLAHVGGPGVVAAHRDDAHQPPRRAAAQQAAQRLEGGLVAPLRVLDPHQRQPVDRRQVLERRLVQAPRRRGLADRLREEAPPGSERQVLHHAERPQRGGRLRVAAQRPRPGVAPDPLAHQRGLADARLAGDQGHRTRAARGLARHLVEALEFGRSFVQGHRRGR